MTTMESAVTYRQDRFRALPQTGRLDGQTVKRGITESAGATEAPMDAPDNQTKLAGKLRVNPSGGSSGDNDELTCHD